MDVMEVNNNPATTNFLSEITVRYAYIIKSFLYVKSHICYESWYIIELSGSWVDPDARNEQLVFNHQNDRIKI